MMELRREKKRRTAIFMTLVLLFCMTSAQWTGGVKRVKAQTTLYASVAEYGTSIRMVFMDDIGTVTMGRVYTGTYSNTGADFFSIYITVDPNTVVTEDPWMLPAIYYNQNGERITISRHIAPWGRLNSDGTYEFTFGVDSADMLAGYTLQDVARIDIYTVATVPDYGASAYATPVPEGAFTPTPTPEPTETPWWLLETPAPEPTETPWWLLETPTPVPEPTETPWWLMTPTPVPEPTETPWWLATPTPTPVPTPTPTVQPTVTPTPIPAVQPTVTPTLVPTPTKVPTVTPAVETTAVPTASEEVSASPAVTGSAVPSQTEKPDTKNSSKPAASKSPDSTQTPEPAAKGKQTIRFSSSIKKTLGDIAFELKPSGNIHSYLTFKSSDKKVASVTSYGSFAMVKINGVGKVKITIQAPETDAYESAKKTITLKVSLNQPKLKVKVKKGVMTIQWSRVKGAAKYQVSVTQHGVKTTTLPLTKKTKLSNTVTKGKKYTVKVRAMDSKKKFPSAWSKKTVKA